MLYLHLPAYRSVLLLRHAIAHQDTIQMQRFSYQRRVGLPLFWGSRFWVLMLCAWAVVLGSSAIIRAADSPESVAEAIELLGAESFKQREAATTYLWLSGDLAVEALKKAVDSQDPEVSHRANRVLRKLHWGIHPKTPPEVILLIKQYRASEAHQRRNLVRKMISKGESAREPLFKMAMMEKDPITRQTIANALSPYLSEMVRRHMLAGEIAKGKQLLEFTASYGDESAIRHYAAYLMMSNQLEPVRKQLAARVAKEKSKNMQQLKMLMYLNRAAGDMKGALASARKIDSRLTEFMLYESGNWQELAKRKGDPVGHKIGLGAKPGIEDVGYAAAYLRLAKRPAEFGAMVDYINQIETKDKYIPTWYVGEALMVNDRFDDAIEIFIKKKKYQNAFELLVARWEYDRAFALAAEAQPEPAERFPFALLVAKTWHNLGDDQKGLQTIAQQENQLNADSLLVQLINAYRELGLLDQANIAAGKAISIGKRPEPVLEALIGQTDLQSSLSIWWKYRMKRYPDEALVDSLRLTADLFSARPVENVEQVIDQFTDAASHLEPEEKAAHWEAASALFEARGLRPMAARDLAKALELGTIKDPDGLVQRYQRLGRLYLADKNWLLAARAFEAARVHKKNDPQLMLLHGHALVRTGQVKQGTELIDMAVLIPLADSRIRYPLASLMLQLDMKSQAKRQWQLIVRTGPIESIYVGQSLLRLSDPLEDKEPNFARRALNAERFRLTCLKDTTSLTRPQYYLSVAAQAQGGAAGALLQQGKPDEALTHGLALAKLGGPSTEHVIALVKAFDAAGHKDHGDKLFASVFNALQNVCAQWPSSALQHNNAAWLAARCNRGLDFALKYADKAVALRPKSPSYLDTLAEVHYRRGDRAKAMELAKRCIQLDPTQAFYRQQLKRFTDGTE